VEAYIDDVRAVRNSQCYRVEIDANAVDESVSRWLAATTTMLGFTAAWVGRAPRDENIVLTPAEARRLNVTTGDTLRLLET
jgi:arginine N-succinyltransferase